MSTTKKKSDVTSNHKITSTVHATNEETPMTTTKKTNRGLADTATIAKAQETPAMIPIPDTPAAPSPTPPAAPYIATCLALLSQVQQLLPATDALTGLDKQRSAKARKGSEQIIPKLLALAEQSGVTLKTVPLDTIRTNLQEAGDLAPLLTQLVQVTKQVGDRVFQMRGESWSDSTKLYTVLRRLAVDDGNLETGLAPIETFFAYRTPAVKKKMSARKGAAKQAATAPVAPTPPVSEPSAPVVTPPVAAAPAPAPSPAPAATPSQAVTATH